MIKKIIYIHDTRENYMPTIVAKLNEIATAVNDLTKENKMPRLVDEEVMNTLEHRAQCVADIVDNEINNVKDLDALTQQDVRFFERCLAGKLIDVLTERGLIRG